MSDKWDYSHALISRYLDTNGDGTGTKNAIGNYAIPTGFSIAPAAGETFVLTRLLVRIEDVGSFDAAAYGNGIALTNGVTVRTADGSGPIVDFTDGLPVKSNAEWGNLCYDVQPLTFGIGNESLLVRFTFEKSGVECHLDGDRGERLEVVLEDDFTGLVAHRFLAQGHNLLFVRNVR